MNSNSVISDIVEKDLCFGCGLCVSVCPKKCLDIKFNDFGEYNPFFCSDQCTHCGLCLKCCIQSGNNYHLDLQEYCDTVNPYHDDLLGKYFQNYVGYSNVDSHRANGSSGGITTWLLEILLSKKIVDAIICVGSNETCKEGLFTFKVLTSVEDIRNNAKSKYYPVECSDAITFVMENNITVAMTALPCLTKNLRLAMQHIKKLRERIKYIISFTCGMGPSSAAAEFICASSGGDPFHLNEISFRCKIDDKMTAKNFAIRCVSNKATDNELVTYQNFFSGLGMALDYRMFSLRACDFCDDVFGEYADISLMDAWHPDYFNDPGGNNIFVIRNREINTLVEEAITRKEIIANVIDAQIVIDSQLPVVDFKRNLIRERIQMAVKANEAVPYVREDLLPYRNTFVDKLRARYRVNTRQISRQKWLDYNKCDMKLTKDLKPLIWKMDMLRRSKKIFSFYSWFHFIKRIITKEVTS